LLGGRLERRKPLPGFPMVEDMVKKRKRKRRIPQRTCVACRRVQGKREMIRIVRTPAGEVQIDPTGKQSGRGAYLCPVRDCWDLALAQRRLEYALKTKLSDEERARLAEFSQTLPEIGDQAREEEPLAGTEEGVYDR